MPFSLSDTVAVQEWRFTGFYGEPHRERRRNSWFLMRWLRAQHDLPWLCAGDFNEVLAAEEHFGSNEREPWQMAGFQQAVTDCGLVDLGFSGLPYTWDNRQDGGRNVKARLDRGLGDYKFMDVFNETSVKHVPLTYSDHAALVFEVKQRVRGGGRRRRSKRPFKYEHMWQRHDSYVDFVNQAWDPGIGACDLSAISSSLTALQSSLSTWDREVFGSV